jgi:hypothetical protein
MAWSSFHRGEYRQLRRGLTIALLEAESMEPRVQLAYSRGLVPAELTAKMGLVRLLLERADALGREALDKSLTESSQYHHAYAESTFSDRALVEDSQRHRL